MNEIKILNNIIKENMMDKFYPKHKENGFTMFNYATWKCGIDGLIAATQIYAPEIVCYNNYVFIKDFLVAGSITSIEEKIARLEKQYHYDKRSIEMSVNTLSIGDFFVGERSVLYDDNEVINQFADCLVYFWKQRVQKVLPNRNIVVKAENDIMGEYGKSITLYEVII